MELNLLDSKGLLSLKHAEEYDAYTWEDLRLFCHYNARYILPTFELIDFLKSQIEGLTAIEIGAGSGDLGRHLNIPMTDSHCQEWPDVQAFYNIIGQPRIKYGKDVERLDAMAAVNKYKPDVVIGAWVTHWIDPGKPPPPGGGNVYGIKDDEILPLVKKYIIIGAEEIHKYKGIMKSKHKNVDASFVRSRRRDNRIWIWEN